MSSENTILLEELTALAEGRRAPADEAREEILAEEYLTSIAAQVEKSELAQHKELVFS